MAEAYERGGKLNRWFAALESPEKALEAIGLIVVKESQRAFDDQKWGDQAWQPRRVPNVFGIIKDFADGKSAPPKRRFDATPALRDTGRLQASIAHRIVSSDTVEIGTNLDYAAVHQYGGDVESETITTEVQESLWTWLKKQSEGLRKELGFLLNPKFTNQKLKGRVPARPFLGITQRIHDDIAASIGENIFEVNR